MLEIDLSPAELFFGGTAGQLTGTAYYQDWSSMDCTQEVGFSSENTSIATVGYAGNPTNPYASPGAVGTVIIDGLLDSTKTDYMCYTQGVCDDNPLQAQASATVNPAIYMNGQNITNTTQNVVVGQQIALTAVYSLANDEVVSDQSWNPQGQFVGGYNPSNSSGSVTPADLTHDSTTFYWIASSGTSSFNVTFDLNLVDVSQTLEALASFKVAAPTSVNVSVTPGNWAINSGPLLQLGSNGDPSNIGMAFQASANAPTGATNNFIWVQIMNRFTIKVFSGSQSVTCTSPKVPGLDGRYPYATGSTTNDNPDVALVPPLVPSIATQVTLDIQPTMYLLWRPGLTNDIPVPLGSVAWQAFGDAKPDSSAQYGWAKQSDSTRSPGTFAPSSSFPPSWPPVFQRNGTFNCQ
jgi:hypothetical protein